MKHSFLLFLFLLLPLGLFCDETINFQPLIDYIYCAPEQEPEVIPTLDPSQIDLISNSQKALYYLYLGRISQKIKTLDEYKLFFQYTIKANITKLKNFTSDLPLTLSYYESAIAFINAAINEDPSAENIAIKAEIMSYYGLLGNLGHIMKNGTSIAPLVKRSLKSDSSNLRALTALIYTKAFSPPIVGGNLKEAKTLLDRLPYEALSKDQQYNVNTTLTYYYLKNKDEKNAQLHLERANSIYPDSILIFVLRELKL